MKKTRFILWTFAALLLLPACKRIDLDKKVVIKVDVPVEEAANCYIIAPGGFLTFHAVKGNTGDVITFAQEAAVMWETDNTAKAVKKGSIIKNVSYKDGVISIEAGSKEGNALVIAEDGDGMVLWSWHIWVTWYNPDDHCINVGSYKMLDRNLGALTSTATDPLSFGLLYFSSRKDPFPGMAAFHEAYTSDAGHHGTVRAAVSGYLDVEPVNAPDLGEDLEAYMRKNPHKQVNYYGASRNSGDLWKDTGKSISDPCPHGYRVASNSLWSNVVNRYLDAKYSSKCADWSATSDWSSLALPQCGYGPAARNYLICVQNPDTDNKGMRYSAYMAPPSSSSYPYEFVWLSYNDGTGKYNSSVHFSSNMSYLASGAVRCMKM